MSGRAALAALALTGAGYLWWRQQQDAPGGQGDAITAPAPLDPAEWLRQQSGGTVETFDALQAGQAQNRQGGRMAFNFAPIFAWGMDRLSGLFGGGGSRPSSGSSTAPDRATGTPPFNPPGGARASTPLASASAPGGVGGADFGATESRYNLPRGYLARTAQIESAMNPNARNPRSSAGGLFQFIDSTARAYGLRNRFDPVQATDAAGRLGRDNARHLRGVLGREPTGAELYLAHQQGAGGAARLLRDPNARAVDVVGRDAVRLNGGGDDMTAGQFAGLWLNKFNRGV